MNTSIKIYVSLLFIGFIFSNTAAQSSDFNPFEMKPEYFEIAKVVNGQEVSANGHRYLVVLDKNTRGIKIWATKKNGKKGWLRHGKYYYYSHATGKLDCMATWHYGVYHGEYKTFHANGNVLFHYNYKDGKKHGFYKRYYNDGSLREVGLKENGKWEGKITSYFDGEGNSTGVVSRISNYQNGKQHGEQLSYFSNGKPMYRKNYDNGKQVGKTVNYSWRK